MAGLRRTLLERTQCPADAVVLRGGATILDVSSVGELEIARHDFDERDVTRRGLRSRGATGLRAIRR